MRFKRNWTLFILPTCVGICLVVLVSILSHFHCKRKVEDLARWFSILVDEGKSHFCGGRVYWPLDLVEINTHMYEPPDQCIPYIEITNNHVIVSNSGKIFREFSDNDFRQGMSECLVEIDKESTSRRFYPVHLKGRAVVAVFKETKWSRVVQAAESCAQAGFTDVSFLFKSPRRSKAEPPGESSVDSKIQEIMEDDEIEDFDRTFFLERDVLFPETCFCPQAREALMRESVYDVSFDLWEQMEIYSTTIPEAIKECGCWVDFNAFRSALWALMHVDMFSAVEIKIAVNSEEMDQSISLDGSTQWIEAHRRILKASGKGTVSLEVM